MVQAFTWLLWRGVHFMNVRPTEILLFLPILGVDLPRLGPKKLPELAGSLCEAINEFGKGILAEPLQLIPELHQSKRCIKLGSSKGIRGKKLPAGY